MSHSLYEELWCTESIEPSLQLIKVDMMHFKYFKSQYVLFGRFSLTWGCLIEIVILDISLL